MLLQDVLHPTQALRDVVAGQLDVDTSGPGALCMVDSEEAADLAEDVIEVSGLAAAFRVEGVAVHRVALPYDGVAGVGDGAHDRSK